MYAIMVIILCVLVLAGAFVGETVRGKSHRPFATSGCEK